VVSGTYAERLHRVIDAGVALNAELSLDELLQRIVESAADLTSARYVALGVIDDRGADLERFITHGMDDEMRRTIGELPRGRGVLGALIRDARPLRLDDLHADPRSVGFPPGHPPMSSFLGVPIFLRGISYGNLYLTEKPDGAGFTEEDERLIRLLAAQAAVAIENARLYESSIEWSRRLESLAEVSKALANEYEPTAVLGLVCERILELVHARFVYVSLQRPDGTLEIAAAAGERAAEAVGRRLDGRRSKSAGVMQRLRGERVDSMLDDVEADRSLAREWGIRAAIFVPLVVAGEPIGVISVNDRTGRDARFSESEYRLVQEFADRAAISVDLSQRVQREAVSRILEGQELERKRISRELHDETGQALTAILLGLKPLDDIDPSAAQGMRELVRGALASVRRLSLDLRPPALDDFGLVAALERLSADLQERSDVEITLAAFELEGRLPEPVETALYRVTQEAVGNAIRHGDAGSVRIELARERDSVRLTVSDDGSGFAPDRVPTDRFGLVGMRERLMLLNGTLTVESRPGHGTRIVALAPVDTA
jgi:signal transduction histidine kinase